MGYKILDIEITRRLSSISLLRPETGMGVILRKNGKPIAFWMEPASKKPLISQADLAESIIRRTRQKLIAESIQEELLTKKKSSTFPSLTIAICSKDRTDQLERCLKSVRSLAMEVSGVPVSVEIIAIDNAPADDMTQRLVAGFADVRYVRENRPGLNFARNRALKEAEGQLLAYLDDDVTVDSLWLEGLMEAWADHRSAGAFTGLVLPYALSTAAQILFEENGGWRKSFDRIVYGRTLPGNPLYPCGAGMFGTGANMAFRRDVLLAIGGFDEALDTGPPLPGGGDLDIFYRVISAGHELVYDPKYMVFHEHRATLEALRRQYRSWGLCLMTFIAKFSKKGASQSLKFRRLRRLWFKLQIQNLIKSMMGRYVLPPDMVAAELWGAMVGSLGEYSRSQKRIDKIKRQIIQT